jgi:hypothetical protein
LHERALVVELSATLRTRAADGAAVRVPLDVEVIATMRAGHGPVHIDMRDPYLNSTLARMACK